MHCADVPTWKVGLFQSTGVDSDETKTNELTFKIQTKDTKQWSDIRPPIMQTMTDFSSC